MSPIEFSGEDVLIDGVPSRQLVSALKAAGLSDESVTALLGRAISRSPALGTPAATTATFTFQTKIAPAAPECAADYARGFFHPDFFDGLTVVQAGQTPEELGFNARFHAIEDDLDAIATNLSRLSNCLAELRSEVSSLVRELEDKLTEIDARLDTKGKEKEDTKDTKETKEKEDDKDGKDKEKEDKEGKESKEGHKDNKEGKEKEDKEDVDKAAPKEIDDPLVPTLEGPGEPGAAPATEPTGVPRGGRPAATRRTFIRPDERPPVGERALRAAGDG
jgi:hypothetical protein